MQPHYDLILHVLHDITLHMFLKTVCSILNFIQGLLSQLLRLIQLLSIKTKRTTKQKQNMEIFLFPFQLEGDERKNLDQVFI